MEWHPYAKLFPMLDDDGLQALADDIRENGLSQPIIIDKHERIIDGRNRAAACTIAGVEPIYEPFAGNDAAILNLVISLNLHRRHLTESQRAMVAGELAKLPKGANQHGSIDPSSTLSRKEAAKALNVGEASVTRAKKVKSHGTEELQSEVVAGNISVSKAAKIAGLPKEKQAAAVQVAKAPKPHVPRTKPYSLPVPSPAPLMEREPDPNEPEPTHDGDNYDAQEFVEWWDSLYAFAKAATRKWKMHRIKASLREVAEELV